MRLFLSLLLTIPIVLALGLGSAWYMIAVPRAGTVEVGAWRALPAAEAETIDPYTRARIARTGEIAMAAGEGLTFVATHDDPGHDLEGNCEIHLVADTAPARLWTLTATGADGEPVATPSKRTHMSSREVLRDGNGHWDVVVNATARSGNWLPGPGKGGVRLTLRLYDTPFNLGSSSLPTLPKVEQRACR